MDDLAARSPRRLTMAHGRRGADQVVEGGAAAGVLLQPVDLALQVAHRERVADRDDDPLGRGRLDEEVAWRRPAWPATTVSMPPVAVSTITGWSKPRARISSRVSWPDMPGMTRSSRTTSAGAAGARRSIACVAALGVGDGEALALQHRLDQPALGRDRRRRRGPSWSLNCPTTTCPTSLGSGSFWDGYDGSGVNAGLRAAITSRSLSFGPGRKTVTETICAAISEPGACARSPLVAIPPWLWNITDV